MRLINITFIAILSCVLSTSRLGADDDIVDGNVDELYEETDKTHDKKSDAGCGGNSRKFLLVRLRALAQKVVAVLRKELEVLKRAVVGTGATHQLLSLQSRIEKKRQKSKVSRRPKYCISKAKEKGVKRLFFFFPIHFGISFPRSLADLFTCHCHR